MLIYIMLIVNVIRSIAKHFFPSVKHYPLINEIVYLLQLPSTDIGR
jgi:hypothetical protein